MCGRAHPSLHPKVWTRVWPTPQTARTSALTSELVLLFTSLFDSNIKPVREALRQKSLGRGGGSGEEEECRVPFFPFVPWERKHSKVAVGIVLEVESFRSSSRRYSSPLRGSGMGRLHRIMSFPRLLQEFHTFCKKALCSESLVFLMEVLEFRELSETSSDEDAQFVRFISIASKFIKRDAPCEINIGSQSKAAILSFLDRGRFNGLGMVRKYIVRRGLYSNEVRQR